MAFFHAMFLFPKVAQKVYEEIVTVTEGTRMPRIEDRTRLPFTEATWKEAWRWNPFFPFGTETITVSFDSPNSFVGVPHVSSEDEILDGYLVKAGTLIVPHTGFALSFVLEET
jgi:cytochrome P450